MQKYGVFYLARADVNISEQYSDTESIEKLLDITVIKTKQQCRENDRRFFAVGASAVDNKSAEYKLLKYGCN